MLVGPQVRGVRVVHDGDRDLFRPACGFCPDVERVLPARNQARDLLLNDGPRRARGDCIGCCVAVQSGGGARSHRARAAVLVPCPYAEVLGVLRHVLEGAADSLVSAALDRLQMGIEIRPQIVGGDVAEVRAARSLAQDNRAGGCVRGRVADLNGGVVCVGRSPLARTATVTAAKPGADRSAAVPSRASVNVPV